MTPAELRAWMKRRNISREKAAAIVRLSPEGFRKNLLGYTPISQQTAGLVEAYETIVELSTIPSQRTTPR